MENEIKIEEIKIKIKEIKKYIKEKEVYETISIMEKRIGIIEKLRIEILEKEILNNKSITEKEELEKNEKELNLIYENLIKKYEETFEILKRKRKKNIKITIIIGLIITGLILFQILREKTVEYDKVTKNSYGSVMLEKEYYSNKTTKHGFTGKVLWRYGNSNPKLEIKYKNGRKEESIGYYENKERMFREYYSLGSLLTRYSYGKNGNLMIIEEYSRRKITSRIRYFNGNREIIEYPDSYEGEETTKYYDKNYKEIKNNIKIKEEFENNKELQKLESMVFDIYYNCRVK